MNHFEFWAEQAKAYHEARGVMDHPNQAPQRGARWFPGALRTELREEIGPMFEVGDFVQLTVKRVSEMEPVYQEELLSTMGVVEYRYKNERASDGHSYGIVGFYPHTSYWRSDSLQPVKQTPLNLKDYL